MGESLADSTVIDHLIIIYVNTQLSSQVACVQIVIQLIIKHHSMRLFLYTKPAQNVSI